MESKCSPLQDITISNPLDRDLSGMWDNAALLVGLNECKKDQLMGSPDAPDRSHPSEAGGPIQTNPYSVITGYTNYRGLGNELRVII